MTFRGATHHRHGFAAPYLLRPGLLIVFDGVPGSGRSTQLERIREAQHRLFRVPPVFVQLPQDVQEAVAGRVDALSALRRGRTVFAERWAYDDAVPDLVLLSLTSFTGATPGPTPWTAVHEERRVVLPDGHEGHVGVEVWSAMARRGFYGTCSCVVAL